MRAGKIVGDHRRGKGRLSVHRLTVLRPGPIGDTGVSTAVSDMFVDIAPHVSLKGVNIHREYDRRGNTMKARDESHIQRRTRGRSSGGGIQANNGKIVTKE
jgi:hypothetical protein